MILIYNNGCGYSDHAIHFIEIGDMDPDVAETLLKGRFPGGGLIGSADHIEWREGGASPIFDELSPWLERVPFGEIPRSVALELIGYERARLKAILAASNVEEPRATNIENALAECDAYQRVIEATP